MNDFKSLTEFLSKLSISDLGKHFTTISELYTKPIKSWKKVISCRKESYDFFLLFVIYYSVIVFFLISNSKFVIPMTILEIVLILIPFSFLYIPFAFFRKKWNKKIKSNRLFRLLFVLKIQFNILLLGVILLAKWTEMESLHIIIQNYIVLICLIFISVFPLLLNLKITQKILWVFTNYVFSLIFILILFFVFFKIPDIDLLGKKITLKTPTIENSHFNYDYNFSDLRLDDEYFIVILNVEKKEVFLNNTQFGTLRLVVDIMKMDMRNRKNKIRIIDSLKQLPENEIVLESFELKNEKISKIHLDSLRIEFNKIFYADIQLSDSLATNAKFKSNKTYYKLINKHLKYYDSIHKSEKLIQIIIKTEAEFLVETENSGYVGIFKYNDQSIVERKIQIQNLREKFESREKYSTFFQSIYTFPVDFIIDNFY
jgi:hypothetical protein